MLAHLRDPIWQFVGASVTALAIVAAFVIARLQRRPQRRLVVELLDNASMVEIAKRVREDVEVSFRGSRVVGVNFVSILIANAGTADLPASEFERPLRFLFKEDQQILAIDLPAVFPGAVIPDVRYIDAHEFIVEPVLYNAGNTTIINLLMDRFDGELMVDARIAGVDEIEVLGKGRDRDTPPWLFIGLFQLALGILIGSVVAAGTVRLVPAAVLAVSMAIIGVLGLRLRFRTERRGIYYGVIANKWANDSRAWKRWPHE